MFSRVVKFAAMISGAPFASNGILVQKRLGFLDSCQRQIMGLNRIAIIFRHSKIKARGVENPHHNEGQKRHTPEQRDENRSA